jgi:hypothetical protein
MNGKLLKGVGLALIALPEPITTPIGAGLIAASFILSKHEESKKRKYLRHILGEYLNSYRPFGYGMAYTPKTSANLPYREPKPLYNQVNPNSVTSSVNRNPLANYTPIRFAPKGYAAPSREENKAFVHTLDPRIVAKRYVETGGTHAGFVGYWGRQTKMQIDKTIFHPLKLSPAALS